MENEVTEKDFQALLDKSTEKFEAKLDEKFKGLEKNTEDIGKLLAVKASQEEEDKVQKGGFKNFSDFVQTIVKNPKDERLQKTVNEGSNIEGGFLIPPEFSSRLWERSIEGDIFYQRAQKIPMKSNTISFPYQIDKDHSSNLFGGITMYWKDEEAQYTASAPTFGNIQLSLHKLTGLCYISDEMISDSPISIEPYVSNKFVDALKWKRNEAMLIGTGAGQPLGIQNSDALISAAIDTGQVTDTITYTNLVNMWARTPNKTNLVWVANHNTLPQLMNMTITGGTASTPVWIPSNNAALAPNGSIFGAPIILTEHAASLGDVNDIALVDWSQYIIGEKSGGGIKTATSMHLKFDYDQQTFKISYRWDGQPLWPTYFTPKNGSTLSPFVNLAAR